MTEEVQSSQGRINTKHGIIKLHHIKAKDMFKEGRVTKTSIKVHKDVSTKVHRYTPHTVSSRKTKRAKY